MNVEGLLIAGFHRSGTSAMTQMLCNAGWFPGGDLIPPHWSNPDGHFEDARITALHEAVLEFNGSNWRHCGNAPTFSEEHRQSLISQIHRRRLRTNRWAVKDPRSGFMAEEWIKATGPGLRVLIPMRSPAACADSLMQRHSLAITLVGPGDDPSKHTAFWRDPGLAWRMWLAHHRALACVMESYPSQVVPFLASDVVSKGWSFLEKLVGNALPRSKENGLKPDLFHKRSSLLGTDATDWTTAQQLWATFLPKQRRLRVSSCEQPRKAISWSQILAFAQLFPFSKDPVHEASFSEQSESVLLARRGEWAAAFSPYASSSPMQMAFNDYNAALGLLIHQGNDDLAIKWLRDWIAARLSTGDFGTSTQWILLSKHVRALCRKDFLEDWEMIMALVPFKDISERASILLSCLINGRELNRLRTLMSILQRQSITLSGFSQSLSTEAALLLGHKDTAWRSTLARTLRLSRSQWIGKVEQAIDEVTDSNARADLLYRLSDNLAMLQSKITVTT